MPHKMWPEVANCISLENYTHFFIHSRLYYKNSPRVLSSEQNEWNVVKRENDLLANRSKTSTPSERRSETSEMSDIWIEEDIYVSVMRSSEEVISKGR